MMSVKKELFISYGREPEVISFVTQLKHDLERNGFAVWLDTEDIPAGSDWHGAIGTGLHECKALIAVITNRYISSRYCTGELYTADADQRLIFPVIFEDVDFGSSEKARGVKYVIGGINWTMFRPGVEDYHTSLGKLMQGMKEQGLGYIPGTDATDSGGVAAQMAQLHLSPPTAPPQPHGSTSPIPFQQGFYPEQTPPGIYPQPMPPGIHPPPTSPGIHPQPTPPGIHPPPTPPGYAPPSPYGYQPYYPHQPPPHHGVYYPPNVSPSGQPYYYPPTNPAPPYTGIPPSTTMPAFMPPSTTIPPFMTPPPANQQPCPPSYTELYPASGVLPVATETVETTPSSVPQFKVGMKLEAVDRRFPYFVCVATIMDRSADGRVRIHFDGWDLNYDYWCPPDAIELHPVGWCKKHNWEMQPPLNQSWTSWEDYLKQTDATPADASFFTADQLAGVGSLLFRPNMRLEAKDRQDPSLFRAATIADIKDGRLLIHFDGWGPRYDYWCKPDSTDIHPAHWCGKNNRRSDLQPPKGHFGPFKWSEYFTDTSIIPAPAHLFTDEQRSNLERAPPANLNGFETNMKLEAKDRLNPSLTAVATIADIKDGRLLIHFDGWGPRYDYWCKPDSTDIHPKGWCSRHGQDLQPPRGSSSFNWKSYLKQCSAVAAPGGLFTEAQKAGASGVSFQVGMRLEAKDRLYPTLTCVATIKDITNGQLLIHFDGWDNKYDYWCDPDSTDIHPRGWCRCHGKKLQPPKGSPSFNWNAYLKQCSAVAAPDGLFTEAQKAGASDVSFQVGMRLEAKDRLYPTLTCVATIKDITNGQLLIHFDGWDNKYDYWCDPDSTDIHPRGWCECHGKKLQPPKGSPSFNWNAHLKQCSAVAAPDGLFTEAQMAGASGVSFQVGMRLEAKDRLYPTLTCVATIKDITNGQLLIHFDGWDNKYDYWCDPDSTDIHPRGWCSNHGQDLQPPKGMPRFSWDSYLQQQNANAAPQTAFTSAQKR